MILIITAVFPPEPVVSAQISNDLATFLSKDNDIVVICPKPTRPAGVVIKSEDESKRSFKKIMLKSFVHAGSLFVGRMAESISFGRASAKFINIHSEEISTIYANTWPLFAQLSVARACSKYNIPLVLHIQDIYPESLTDKLGKTGILIKKVLMPIDKYLMRNSKAVIAIGQKMAEFLSATRGINPDKIAIVYNWQDETRYQIIHGSSIQNEKFTFMYLGSLSPSANIESVIDAYGKSELKNSKLVIAGNGNSKDSCMKSASMFHGLDIEFIDAPFEKTPELLSMADVLVLPLRKGVGKYSIPSKLAGYMHSGKPVLAYIDKDSDAADIINSAGCGWVIPAGDEAALIEKMVEISSVPEETLYKIGSAGKAYALKHLSRKANLEKLVQIIRNNIN